MKVKILIRYALAVLLLVGCMEPAGQERYDAEHDGMYDGGIAVDLSHGRDTSELGQETGASLTACGESGESVHRDNLSQLEGCEQSYFRIILSGFLASSIPQLRSLVRSEDLLHVISIYELTDLTDLNRLEFVGADLMIRFMPDLSTLHGLESLRTVRGRLFLTGLGISDLSPLSSLTSVGGLYIDLIHLDSVEGLDSLERIDGDVNISADGVSREELEQLLERVEVTGSIRLNGQDI